MVDFDLIHFGATDFDLIYISCFTGDLWFWFKSKTQWSVTTLGCGWVHISDRRPAALHRYPMHMASALIPSQHVSHRGCWVDCPCMQQTWCQAWLVNTKSNQSITLFTWCDINNNTCTKADFRTGQRGHSSALTVAQAICEQYTFWECRLLKHLQQLSNDTSEKRRKKIVDYTGSYIHFK